MRLALSVAAIGGVFPVLGTLPAAAQTTIPAGVPLRIQVDHRHRVRPGTRIEGHLIAPVYSVDRKVLPAGTRAVSYTHLTLPTN